MTKTFLRRAALVCALGWVIFGSYQMGAFNQGRTLVAYAAQTSVATNTVVMVPIQEEAPVLQRIADCESGGGKPGGAHQFNKNGTVVMHENTNGSIDEGYMQINLTVAHINQAAKLHMDLSTEEGNKAFGKWIFENEGSGPWKASQACWQ